MVPVAVCRVSSVFKGVTTNMPIVPAKAGTHNHSRF
jgi:hypothetical protein